ncbi:MAG: queuosine precursor transporter [Holosporales bacterium]|jgi:uncharacterized PurR-regulated membrane protein YhhQ (DUF165 family)|nr:queuosine precursor transporter [Holosporales bacterium]
MDAFLKQVVEHCHSVPPEFISVVVAGCAILCVFTFYKYFGVTGLHVYNSLVICLANIQILHLTQFAYIDVQVPLGTVLFTTTFLANWIISGECGAAEARKSVLLSSLAYVLFSGHMLLALAHSPVRQLDTYSLQALSKYQALLEIFIPSLRIILASILAYIISQFFYIRFIVKAGATSLAKTEAGAENAGKTPHRPLQYPQGAIVFLQQSLSMFLSSIIDHIVFSIFAFYIFPAVKPTIHLFINGYVVSSFAVRLVTIAICTMSACCYTLLRKK